VNTLQGVNMQACRMGFVDAGVKDNEVLGFSSVQLMDIEGAPR
jgi:hypothetical protein